MGGREGDGRAGRQTNTDLYISTHSNTYTRMNSHEGRQTNTDGQNHKYAYAVTHIHAKVRNQTNTHRCP